MLLIGRATSFNAQFRKVPRQRSTTTVVVAFIAGMMGNHGFANGSISPPPTTNADTANTESKTTRPAFQWQPFSAHYKAIMNGRTLDDNAERKLVKTGTNQFEFLTKAENFLFKLKESSRFQVQGEHIMLLAYHSSRGNVFKTRKTAMSFDWKQKQVHFQDRKTSGTLPLPDSWKNYVDPLTTNFELARQLRAGKKHIQFKLAMGKKIKDRRYQVDTMETLQLPYGELQAWKLIKTDDDKKSTHVWIAPSLNYLVVQVVQKEDDEEYRLELTDYQVGKN